MLQKKNDKETLYIKSIFDRVRNNWQWFALSVFVFLCLGAIKILRSPAQFTRTAQILIKDDKGGNAPDLGELSGFDFLNQSSNIHNELATIQSPDLMLEVVNRLGLYDTYDKKGRFHPVSLYGDSLPVRVELDSVVAAIAPAFRIEITSPNSFTLSRFMADGEDVDGKDVKGTFGVATETPLGSILINGSDLLETAKLPMTIDYAHNDPYQTALNYASALSSKIQNMKASVIEMSFTDECTRRGDDILWKVIEVYNENWLNDRNQVVRNTAIFINERLKDLEAQLSLVDDSISDFKSANLLPDLSATSQRYLDQASKANEALIELDNKIYMAGYLKDFISRLTNNQAMPITGFESNGLSQQISDYNKLVIERNNLVSVSSTSNPAVVDRDAALANMRHAIDAAIDSELATLKEQRRNQALNQDRAVSKIASNPEQAKQLLTKERTQKVQESLYLYLLQKREENDLSKTFTAENARVIKAPNGSPIPTAPKKKFILLAALLIGIVVPYFIIYLRERLETTISSRNDLSSITVPLLGELPFYIPRHLRKTRWEKFKEKFHPKRVDAAPNMVVEKGSRNLINESFRIVRTNLTMMMGRESEHNVVCITSFNPGSGKSFVSMNLGRCFVFKGKKVLVIDCDMRHGSASEYVGTPAHGLSDLLSGVATDPHQFIVPYPNSTDLHVLPVGKIPPNPTELLENGKLDKLVNELRREYDYIFMDCPPIKVVADTSIINQMSDRVVFVVRVGMFQREMVPELQEIYDAKRYRNMSIVLNGVPYTIKQQARRTYHYYVEE